MTLIKDPVEGRAARVDHEGNLRVFSTSETQESNAAHEGNSYSVGLVQGGVDRALTLATGNTYNLLYLKNLDDDMYATIAAVLGGMDVTGGQLFMVKNPTEGVLANNVEVTPVNNNFASNKLSQVEAHVWDEVGTAGITGLTGGEEFFSMLLGAGPFTLDSSVWIHLGLQDSLLIGVENGTGGAIEATLNLRFLKELIDQLG